MDASVLATLGLGLSSILWDKHISDIYCLHTIIHDGRGGWGEESVWVQVTLNDPCIIQTLEAEILPLSDMPQIHILV